MADEKQVKDAGQKPADWVETAKDLIRELGRLERGDRRS